MPCEWYKLPNGTVMHVNRGRGGRRRVCKFCRRSYSEGKTCYFPIGHGKTCDAEMCDDCAITLGSQETDIGGGMKRMGDSIDVCPIHRDQAVVRNGKFVTSEAQ